MSERTYYVLCADNCKFESMTKQQILSAIYQGVTYGTIDVGEGLVSQIREINHNANISFWIGTQAEYNAISQREENVIYIISDDTSKEELIADVEALAQTVDGIQTAVTTAASDIAAVDEAIDDLAAETTDLETAIDGLEANMTTISGSVDDLEDDIDDLNTLKGQITSGGQVVLHESTNNTFLTSLQTFALSASHTGYHKLMVIIKVKAAGVAKADRVTSTAIYYPAALNGDRFCIETYRSKSASAAPVVGMFSTNEFYKVCQANSLNSDPFDLKIIGII